MLVAESVRAESALASDDSRVPEAAVIWRKAQARTREQALREATLPIRVVRTCAAVLAILAVPWIAFEFPRPPAWLPSLGKHFSWMDSSWLGGNWLAALTGTTVLGITASFVCIGLSSWYMLREK